MTITLEFSDEQARRLESLAARSGQSVEDYLHGLVEREALACESRALPDLLPERRSALSDAEWKRAEDELIALVCDKIPPLPDEAFRRDTMYRE